MSLSLTQVRAKQAHRRVAILLGIFLAIHFATHFSALDSVSTHTTVLELGRAIYQIPIIEIALVLAFATQVIFGIRLLVGIHKRKRKDAWHWAQFLSGAYLAYFIVQHTAAALLSRLVAGIDTNFYWPAGTLILTPLKYGFAPYYALAVTALVTHIMAALHFRMPKPWHSYVLPVGPIAAAAIVLAYSGALYSVKLPQQHLDFFDGYGSLPEE